MTPALLVLSVLAFTTMPEYAGTVTTEAVLQNYSQNVSANYKDSLAAAKKLQTSVDTFLAKPSQETLDAARAAWTESRIPYLQTEAYRFYGGPIDFSDPASGGEGPEGRINAWPLNEAYIDGVKDNPKSGIINNTNADLSIDALSGKNQEKDEADVATGYHAIEFLLWGQDFSKDGPGTRLFTDYEPGSTANDRRRTYLKNITQLLVNDLQFLADSWDETGKDNYAKAFLAGGNESLGKTLTALATLSGFELASERIATALDSGDQEDEHSCFSDTTRNDFVFNARGIRNVFMGYYNGKSGPGLHALLKEKDAALADTLARQLEETEKLMNDLPQRIDRDVLAASKDSEGRQTMEKIVAALQKQADLFKQAGKALGVDVSIVSE